MLKRLRLLFSLFFLVFQLQACELFFGKTIEGRLDMEVALRGFSLESGLDMDNRNFIIHDGIAYELVFLPDTKLKNITASKDGVAVPVPAELGKVRLEPGGLYRVKGKVETTGDRFDTFPVEMIRLRSIEYLGSGDGGLHIRF